MTQPFPPNMGPIAPERNPPIHPEYYEPKKFNISAISLGFQTIVTTSVPHDYVIGQLVRLLIPFTYGCRDLNEQEGYVVSIPAADQVTLALDSRNANAFIPNPGFGPTPPQIVAIGDINSGLVNSSGTVNMGTYIPGSFKDIS